MSREWVNDFRIFLEALGIDVLHFATLIFITLALLNYKDFRNWDKLKWNEKL